jgi:hypothetical protein
MKTLEHIDLRTLADLYDAQPIVTAIDEEAAAKLVQAMSVFSATNKAQVDCVNAKYWMAQLTDLLALTKLGESFHPRKAGQICRQMGLVLHRRNDGNHVAWSETQLNILKKAFDLE